VLSENILITIMGTLGLTIKHVSIEKYRN